MLLFKHAILSKGVAHSLHGCSASSRVPLHLVCAPKYRHISTPSPAKHNRHDRDYALATWPLWFAGVLGISAVTWTVWREYQPFRYTVLAAVRCSRVAGELVLAACYFATTV
jgi:hypothetical protein